MKNIITIILVLVSLTSFSQIRNYDVTFEPINLHVNSALIGITLQDGRNAITAEFGIPIHNSIMNRTLNGLHIGPNIFNNVNMYSIITRLGYRHYLHNENIYCETSVKNQVSHFNGSLSNSTFYGVINNNSLNEQLGYQFIISKLILLDFYAGVSVARTNMLLNSYSDNELDADYVYNQIHKWSLELLPKNANLVITKNKNFIDGKVNPFTQIYPFAGLKIVIRIASSN